MNEKLEEYWLVTYRTLERVKTEMSHMGDHWDAVNLGEWETLPHNFEARQSAAAAFWAYVDQGYDCRFKHVLVRKEITNEPAPQRPK